MKTHILTLLFTLAGLAGMAQTNQPLPPDAQPLTALTYLSPSDSTVWLYNERSSLAINVGVWADVVELFETGWSNTQIDSAITAQIGVINFPVTSVNSMTGDVVLAPNDLGLGNVDNTSDLNKPVSTATQNALDGKEDKTNKVTSLSTPNNTTYPTTEAVKNAIDAIEPPDVTGSNGIQVVAGEVSPIYGTTSGTVAQGNDSRINNGQTAFGWGDFRQFGLGAQTNHIASLSDFNLFDRPNSFISANSASNVPFLSLGTGINISYSSSRSAQLWFNVAFEAVQFRTATSSGVWGGIYDFWTTKNFTPSDYIPLTQKGAANGVAALDGGGKVPASQLPTTGMQYRGTWNAATNTPALSNSTGTEGHFYRVTTAGTQNLGSGNISFSVGDDVIHNGSVWQRAPSGTTATNLALGTRTGTTMPITNSNGTGITLPTATTSLAGLISSSDKTKLDNALTSEADPNVPFYVKDITSGDIANWNAAYGWGNPADKKYIAGTSTGPMVDIFTGNYNDLGSGLVYGQGGANNPGGNGLVFTMKQSNTLGVQFQGSVFSNTWYGRRLASTWQPWVEFWHSANFDPSAYTIPWSRVTSKPTAFTPSPHTHSAADIDAGTLAAARIGNATVSNAKLSNMAANTFKGRVSSTGVPQDLTAAQVKSALALTTSDVTEGSNLYFTTGRVRGVSLAGLSVSTSPIVSSDPVLTAFGKAQGQINERVPASRTITINGVAQSLWENRTWTLTAADVGAAVIGTGSTQVRNNSQLDARYLQSVSGGSGISVSGNTISVDNTVLRTTGNQTKSGTLGVTNIMGTSTTASSSIPTNAQSLFTASVSSNTSYTLTNLTGSPRHIQVMVTNTGSSAITLTFNATFPVNQTTSVNPSSTAIFTFLINGGIAYGTKTQY